MEKLRNSNILSLGLSRAKSGFLNFFKNKINRTTTQKFFLLNGQLTPEIICPFVTWSWSIRVFPTLPPTSDFFVVKLNGVIINVKAKFDPALDEFWFHSFDMPGEPYLERQDTIEIQSRLGQDAEFYILFHRVMFDNE